MIYNIFNEVVEKYFAKNAIIYEQVIVTYQALNELVLSIDETFKSIPKNNVVGIFTDNPILFVVVYLSSSKNKTKIVPIDRRLACSEIESLIKECQVTHIVSDSAIEELITLNVTFEVKHSLGEANFLLYKINNMQHCIPSYYQSSDYIVQYTSGSTGKPKGIALSQKNISSRVMNWSHTIELNHTDIILCTLTLSHSHGSDVLMLPGLLNGCTIIAPELSKLTPRRICKLIDQYNVTVFSSLPFMYELILKTVPSTNINLSSLRHMISGSAPLNSNSARDFLEKFGKGISQVYGLSEIGPICFSGDPSKFGYIGHFVHGIESQIVPTDTYNENVGELIVKGESLSRGYLNSPSSLMTMYKNDWLWTQDIVSVDSNGLQIQGRKSSFINSGGNKIDPREVEAAIQLHPDINEVVVVGVSDPVKTEKIIAFITKDIKSEVHSKALHLHLKGKLAAYKIPDLFVFVPEIPKSPLGKVQVTSLLEVL